MSETTTMKKGLSSVVGVLMIFTLTQATFVLTPALSLLSENIRTYRIQRLHTYLQYRI